VGVTGKDFADCYLVIKLQAGGEGGYRLDAYQAVPTGSEEPLASAPLPALAYARLAQALTSILSNRPTPQPMGDYLAEWLFIEQPDTTPHPLTPSPPLPFIFTGVHEWTPMAAKHADTGPSRVRQASPTHRPWPTSRA